MTIIYQFCSADSLKCFVKRCKYSFTKLDHLAYQPANGRINNLLLLHFVKIFVFSVAPETLDRYWRYDGLSWKNVRTGKKPEKNPIFVVTRFQLKSNGVLVDFFKNEYVPFGELRNYSFSRALLIPLIFFQNANYVSSLQTLNIYWF